MWEHTGTGEVGRWAHIDGALEFKKGPPKYSYLVKVTLSREAIKSLRIETDLMTSPHALARLSVGGNKVQYTDDTAEPHEVTVTHVWRESDSVEPPEPPAEPISPDHGETVRATTVPFRWTPVRHAKWYHIRVSRCEDMKLAYRPSFDAIIESAEHHCPFAGMFNPDEQYYWQVRVCNAQGVWGRWSTVWKFKWQGPRIPTGLSPASKLGRPYRYEVKTLGCLGDLQYRYARPNTAFWETEGYEFELADKPAWLSVDTDSGILTGTPGAGDRGTSRVIVICRRRFPHELKPGDHRPSYFLKEDPRFQASHQQTFELSVRCSRGACPERSRMGGCTLGYHPLQSKGVISCFLGKHYHATNFATSMSRSFKAAVIVRRLTASNNVPAGEGTSTTASASK